MDETVMEGVGSVDHGVRPAGEEPGTSSQQIAQPQQAPPQKKMKAVDIHAPLSTKTPALRQETSGPPQVPITPDQGDSEEFSVTINLIPLRPQVSPAAGENTEILSIGEEDVVQSPSNYSLPDDDPEDATQPSEEQPAGDSDGQDMSTVLERLSQVERLVLPALHA